MGRPEIMRSGEVSLGDNPAGNEVDEKQKQPNDTIGPVPDGNTGGHQHTNDDPHDDDPDKPVAKFAERFPADDDVNDVADDEADHESDETAG
jgi:hypothetical protein